MYIESVPNRNSPQAILLRESYRDGGKGGVAKLVEIAVAGVSSGISLSHHAARSMH